MDANELEVNEFVEIEFLSGEEDVSQPEQKRDSKTQKIGGGETPNTKKVGIEKSFVYNSNTLI